MRSIAMDSALSGLPQLLPSVWDCVAWVLWRREDSAESVAQAFVRTIRAKSA